MLLGEDADEPTARRRAALSGRDGGLRLPADGLDFEALERSLLQQALRQTAASASARPACWG
jgi:hypothetical protein